VATGTDCSGSVQREGVSSTTILVGFTLVVTRLVRFSIMRLQCLGAARGQQLEKKSILSALN
jgi:hypothetical protein